MNDSKYNNNVFLERASKLIFNSGKTQAELVKALGLSNGTIANLKNKKGQVPSADTVCALSNYFNVSTDWLLGLTETKSTDKATQELCATLGLNEEAISSLKEQTKINNALNFLFKQHEICKKYEYEQKDKYNAYTTRDYSILTLLSEFVKLYESDVKDDVFFEISQNGVLRVGNASFSDNGDFDDIVFSSEYNTNMQGNALSITSATSVQMQKTLNLLVSQLQVLIECKDFL